MYSGSNFKTNNITLIGVHMSTGAADVPAFLWHCDLQCPTLRRFQEGV